MSYRFSINKQFNYIPSGPVVQEDADLPWYTGEEDLKNIDTLIVYVFDLPNHDLPSNSFKMNLTCLTNFKLDSCRHLNQYDRRFVYRRSNKDHDEYNYLKVILSILENYKDIREDRTKVGTYSMFGPQMEFDISESIPINHKVSCLESGLKRTSMVS